MGKNEFRGLNRSIPERSGKGQRGETHLEGRGSKHKGHVLPLLHIQLPEKEPSFSRIDGGRARRAKTAKITAGKTGGFFKRLRLSGKIDHEAGPARNGVPYGDELSYDPGRVHFGQHVGKIKLIKAVPDFLHRAGT